MKCNLPYDERAALKELLKLQKYRIITLKPCDKGAGIMIPGFTAYMKTFYEHLLLAKPNVPTEDESHPNMYYKKEDEFALERAKRHINTKLKEALDNSLISKDEFKAMDPEDKKPSKFYCLFKVHKEQKHIETPPPRPILSGSGSIKEQMSTI